MVRQLQRGSVSVEMCSQSSVDCVNAVQVDVELKGRALIFRLIFDDDDTAHKDDLHSLVDGWVGCLETLSLLDRQIRVGLEEFMDYCSEKFDDIIVELSCGRILSFSAYIEPVNDDGLLFELTPA